MADDNILHQSHYNRGGIEAIAAITAWGFAEGFNRGNAIKHIARAGYKDKDAEIEDLKKAKTYLEFEIERLEGIRNDGKGKEPPIMQVGALGFQQTN